VAHRLLRAKIMMRAIASAIGCIALLAACGPASKGHGDDSSGDDDSGPTADAPACAAESASAMEVKRPVDIIWVIDNSGSMSEEEQRIRDNMNSFAQTIAASGVDYHVIVIAAVSHITVPPPLGGSPRLLQLDIEIDSHNALQKTVEAYPMYSSFLRPDSVKHIVAVSDDESDWSKAMFEQQMATLANPGFGTDWRFNAVVAEAPPFAFGNHCFALSAAVGQVYLDLRVAHNGLFYSLCDTNWDPLFTALAQSVTSGLSLPCTYALPAPPPGMTLDPMKVNFVYTPTGAAPQTIPNVGSMAACTGTPGWYYDNPAMPAQIILCPSTCTSLQGDATGKVTIELGCGTVFQ
jgi:hypothetical protein